MGLCVSIIHFENGLPLMKEIKEQFKKQTGSDIEMNAKLNVSELPLNGYIILYNPLFQEINCEIKENTIIMRIGIGLSGIKNPYFVKSLQKTLFDLGGQFINIQDNKPSEDFPPKSWKELKPWRAYKKNKPKK